MSMQTSMGALVLGAVLALGVAAASPAGAASAHLAHESATTLPVEQVGFHKHGHRKIFRKRHRGKFSLRIGKRHHGHGHFHRGFGHHHHGHKGYVHGHRHHGGKIHFRPKVRIIIN